MTSSNLIEPVLSLLAPHDCISCGAEGKLLCDWCKLEAIPPVPPRCYRCRKQTQDSLTCRPCRSESRLRYVWIASEYQGASKELIGKLKFGRAQAAAEVIAGIMTDTLPYLPKETIVTFVPTATSRRRQRGYDQAELIARHIAKLTGLKFHPLLLRRGQTRQVGATRAKRKEQLLEAFRARNAKIISGSQILLIDDIVTTGATLEAASQVLKQAEVKYISAAAFAQK